MGKSIFHPCAGKRFAYSTRPRACAKLRIAMTQELSGRVAIVTGAGRNIGRAMALAVTADVADADAVATMVAAAASRFGRIDILVNNAAVRAEQALETMTLADWRAVTGVILDGAFNCVKACLPHLKQSSAGAIVNIGGLSAHTGAARRPHVVTAKAGLVG